jgi:hypothetical protein
LAVASGREQLDEHAGHGERQGASQPHQRPAVIDDGVRRPVFGLARADLAYQQPTKE